MEVIKIASEAEREYIGLNNGILDQACIALGEQGKLLFLDTATEQYRLIEPGEDLGKYEIAIIFSGLTRSLVNSDYNLRVSECKTAAWCMQAYKEQPIRPLDQTFLRDVPLEMYEETKDRMPARFARRAEHFYSEYRRVRKGVTAWESGNMELFGQLIKQSCESSIHNYECGSPELIAIYTILKNLEGVYGGRFSGAGFKGAVIALVDPAYKKEVEESITREYLAQYPEYKKTFGIYWVHSTDGARFVEA
jgi:galactokinase/galacturonokinase